MIDISSETVLSLSEAAKRLPGRRQNKKPNVATLYRWSNVGCRGARLETVQVGATRCTSVEALQRFFDSLTTAAKGSPLPPPPLPKSRRRAIEAAEKRLARSGI